MISLISRGILTFSVSPENLSFLPVNKCKQKGGKGSLTALLDQTTRIINGHVEKCQNKILKNDIFRCILGYDNAGFVILNNFHASNFF